MNSLMPTEQNDLERLESIVAKSLETFLEVGTALMEIRDRRLYRAGFETFEEYCRERWGMVASRARQLIAAVETATNLESVTTVTPQSERQLRPLAPLPPEQQREAWSLAVEQAPEGTPTARHVEAAVAQVTGQDKPREPLPGQREMFEEEEPEEEGWESDEADPTVDAPTSETEIPRSRIERPTPPPPNPGYLAFSKLWDDINLFLVSLPRRGGILGLLKDKDKNRPLIQGTYTSLVKLGQVCAQCVREMEESYSWLESDKS